MVGVRFEVWRFEVRGMSDRHGLVIDIEKCITLYYTTLLYTFSIS